MEEEDEWPYPGRQRKLRSQSRRTPRRSHNNYSYFDNRIIISYSAFFLFRPSRNWETSKTNCIILADVN
uniref:Uncharacterized protein n=1 Tax=Caenorhabditis tropicalis TaxID=1561998 RepID=A0A1I7U9B0_9PELO